MLIQKIIILNEIIIFDFVIENFENLERIFIFIFLFLLIFGKYNIIKGKIVKEVKKIIIRDIIIIFPKSIIGLIFENNKEAKATIVVRDV